ncbi:hypothetical protein [Lapidilactobacillus wuchangensis]|jgi:hypothetical protein|uniref:hypothetical protein n=1 Tax=Lapidilactobacillus wuchangensis TaxID=2486001 RepID=UPI0013DDD1C8|nr:hypothetical protein [Lapidilactobacillus wuchangensis]
MTWKAVVLIIFGFCMLVAVIAAIAGVIMAHKVSKRINDEVDEFDWSDRHNRLEK